MCNEDNKPVLIAYLYGELALAERRVFESHLASCAACSDEVAALRATREDLIAWAPPECRDLPSSWIEAPAAASPAARLRAWAPAFGLAAAAALVLAASASVANLEIRYGADGLVVRTGRAPVAAAAPRVDAPAARQSPAVEPSYVTASELAEFEARLRATFAAPDTRGLARTASISSATPQLSADVRRLPADVRRWIEESEERTRQEMASRFLDLVRDFEGHRRADMMRVQQVLGQVQRTTGAEAAQTRDIVNRLMLVSQQER